MPLVRVASAVAVSALLLVGCTSEQQARPDDDADTASDDATTGSASGDTPTTTTSASPSSSPSSSPSPSTFDPTSTTLEATGAQLDFTPRPVPELADRGEGFDVGAFLHTGERWVIAGDRLAADGTPRPLVLGSADGDSWQPADVSALPDGRLNGATTLVDGSVVVVGSASGLGPTPAIVATGGDALSPVDDETLAPGTGLSLSDVHLLPDGTLVALGSTLTEDLDERIVAVASPDGQEWAPDGELTELVAGGTRPSWGAGAVTDDRAVVFTSRLDGGTTVVTPLTWIAGSWTAGSPLGGGAEQLVYDVVALADGSLLAIGAVQEGTDNTPAAWTSDDGLEWTLVSDVETQVAPDHDSISTFGETLFAAAVLDDGSLRGVGFLVASWLALRSDDGRTWVEVPLPTAVVDTSVPQITAVATDGTDVLAVSGGDQPLLFEIGDSTADVGKPPSFPTLREDVSVPEVVGGADDLVSVVTETRPTPLRELSDVTGSITRITLDGEVQAGPGFDSVVVQDVLRDEQGILAVGHDVFGVEEFRSRWISGETPSDLVSEEVGSTTLGTPRLQAVARLPSGLATALGNGFSEEGVVGAATFAPQGGSIRDLQRRFGAPPLQEEFFDDICDLPDGGVVGVGSHQAGDEARRPLIVTSSDGTEWKRTVELAEPLGRDRALTFGCTAAPEVTWILGSADRPTDAALWSTTDGVSFEERPLPELGEDTSIVDGVAGDDGLWLLVSGDDGARRVTSLVRLTQDDADVQPLVGPPFTTDREEVRPTSIALTDDAVVLVGEQNRTVTLFTAPRPG